MENEQLKQFLVRFFGAFLLSVGLSLVVLFIASYMFDFSAVLPTKYVGVMSANGLGR